MLRVFRSNSPLLDFINIDIYSNPEDTGITSETGGLIKEAAMFLISNMDLSSKDNYLTWVFVWKELVSELSVLSHHMKRPKTYSDTYESIRRATIFAMGRNSGFRTYAEYEAHEEEMHEAWNVLRRQFVRDISEALTALYNARLTGKFATSHIHAMTRSEGTNYTAQLIAA